MHLPVLTDSHHPHHRLGVAIPCYQHHRETETGGIPVSLPHSTPPSGESCATTLPSAELGSIAPCVPQQHDVGGLMDRFAALMTIWA